MKRLIATGVVSTLALALPTPTPSAAYTWSVPTYGTCYNLWGTMADGSSVRPRSVASNTLKLGTKIRLVGKQTFGGIRKFVVRDTGGALWDGHLDFWFGLPHDRFINCALWGSRPLRFKLGWKK